MLWIFKLEKKTLWEENYSSHALCFKYSEVVWQSDDFTLILQNFIYTGEGYIDLYLLEKMLDHSWLFWGMWSFCWTLFNVQWLFGSIHGIITKTFMVLSDSYETVYFMSILTQRYMMPNLTVHVLNPYFFIESTFSKNPVFWLFITFK